VLKVGKPNGSLTSQRARHARRQGLADQLGAERYRLIGKIAAQSLKLAPRD